MTNNLSYMQIVVWIHDHVEDPHVGYLEDWAKSYHKYLGPTFTNNSWDNWPSSFEAVEGTVEIITSWSHGHVV
jgi:hypothetical protein